MLQIKKIKPDKSQISFFFMSPVIGGAERILLDFLQGTLPTEYNCKFFVSSRISENFPKSLSPVTVLPYLVTYKGICHALVNRVLFIMQSCLLTVILTWYYINGDCRYVYVNGSIAVRYLWFLVCLPGITRLAHIHEMPRAVMHKNLLKFTLKHYKSIVVPSQSVKNELVKILSVSEEKIVVIYNGIVLNEAKKCDWDSADKKQPLIVGFAGAFIYDKGVDVLIKSWARLNNLFPDVRLKIATLYIDESFIKDLKSQVGLDAWAKVDFKFYPNDQMEFFYDSIDVLVLPTRHESFGMVLVEAMSRGKGVLASNLDGPAEILQECQLFAVGNSEDLFAKLIVINNGLTQYRSKNLKKNIEFVRQNFSFDAFANQLEKHLESVLDL